MPSAILLTQSNQFPNIAWTNELPECVWYLCLNFLNSLISSHLFLFAFSPGYGYVSFPPLLRYSTRFYRNFLHYYGPSFGSLHEKHARRSTRTSKTDPGEKKGWQNSIPTRVLFCHKKSNEKGELLGERATVYDHTNNLLLLLLRLWGFGWQWNGIYLGIRDVFVSLLMLTVCKLQRWLKGWVDVDAGRK